MTDIDRATVVIVGGGPVGLSCALLLERAGIDVLVFERRDFSAGVPRAHLLNVRTMEAFHDMGVADDIYGRAPAAGSWNRVSWYTSLAGPTPLHGRRIGQVDAWGGGPDLERYAEASPRRFANLPQIRLDRLLWRNATVRCPGRVLPEQEVVGLDVRDDGVAVTVEDRPTGTRRVVEADYVIAADGGRTCAELLGVELIGRRGIGRNVTTLYVTMDLADHADEQSLLTWLISPLGNGGPAGTLQALGPDDWTNRSTQWSISVRPPGTVAYSDEEAVARAKEILGLPELEIDVHAVARWRYDAIVADRFRAGRAFLAGDAAHRHPPTGGLGLNTGVQDAHNLCWKLAAVINGWAGDALLDSYEAERRPIAIANIEHSLSNAGKHHHIASAMGLEAGQSEAEGWAELALWASDGDEGRARRAATDEALATNAEDYSQLNIEAGFAYERGALVPDGTPPPPGHASPIDFAPTARPGHHVPHVWLEHGEQRVSTVDLVTHDALTLFVATPGVAVWHAAAERAIAEQGCRVVVVEIGPDARFGDPAGAWTTAGAVTDTGAILVRPDKHVAYRSAATPADAGGELGLAIRRVLHETAGDAAVGGTLSLDHVEHAIRELGGEPTGAPLT